MKNLIAVLFIQYCIFSGMLQADNKKAEGESKNYLTVLFHLAEKLYYYPTNDGSYKKVDSAQILKKDEEFIDGFNDKVLGKKGDLVFTLNKKRYLASELGAIGLGDLPKNLPDQKEEAVAATEEKSSTKENETKKEEKKAEYPIELSDDEKQIVEETNRLRVAKGLNPLVVDVGLMQNARSQSAAMANAGRMKHSLVGNSGGWRAENVAWNQFNGTDAVNSWFNSRAGHKENMLNPNYTSIGVGGVSRYWTQQFR